MGKCRGKNPGQAAHAFSHGGRLGEIRLSNCLNWYSYLTSSSDSPATVVENLQTAYQVGKGFVERVAGLSEEEVEKDAEESDEGPSSESAEASDESAVDENDAESTPELSDPEPAPEEAPISTDAWASAEEKIPVRQRMRFRMAED